MSLSPFFRHSATASFSILLLLNSTIWSQSVSPRSTALAEDPLIYSSGTLKGESEGTGWRGPWGGSSAESFLTTETGVKVEGLTAGGAEGISINAVRRFTSPLPEDAPIYFSVEIQINELSHRYISVLRLHQSQTGDPEHFVGIGIMNNQVLGMGGTLSAQDGRFEEIPSSGTFLLVGKIAFDEEGKANLSVWVNPKNEASTTSMKTFENIGISKAPFLVAELFVTKQESPGDILFRNLFVSEKWPVPAEN